MSENDSPTTSIAEREPESRAELPRVQVEDTGLIPMYTNFCRVTGTPEEVIIDFGLNTEPFAQNTHAIKMQQRMVANFYTDKRLLTALTVAVQRHERAFGVIETDVNKRVRVSQ